jgi:hypothetical protein
MSYDIQIWSVFQPSMEESQAGPTTWKYHDGSWSLRSGRWQILVSSSPTLSEDVPAEISSRLPGIQFCTELALQPIDAPDSARKRLFQVARALAKTSHGLILNRQTDEIIYASGIKRYVPRARPERFSIIELGWWFVDDQLFSREALIGLISLFETFLPEAIPRRYGLYEPPQFSVSVNGREHLIDFLCESIDDAPVLYTTRPVLGMSFSCTRERYDERSGFKSNYLSIEIEASVVEQPGWQLALRRFWLEASTYLDVFYSEARTLAGFLPMGPTFGYDNQTERNPIRSWFWRGIPEQLGHAFAIGKRYIELWPDVRDVAESYGDLYVLDTGQWGKEETLTIDVPPVLRQVHRPRHENVENGNGYVWVDTYPKRFPFAEFRSNVEES